MPFIELGTEFADAQEAEIVPEAKYDLVCGTIEHTNEGGKNNIRVLVNHINPVNGIANPATIFHYLPLPVGDDSPEKAQTKCLFTKRFLYHFGIPFVIAGEQVGFDTDNITGAKMMGCPVVSEEYEKRWQNKLNLPDMPQNVEAPTGRSKPRRRS